MGKNVMTIFEKPSKVINLIDGNFQLKTHDGRSINIPLEFIEGISSSEASLDNIADMLWFQNAIRDTKSFKWAKISDLVGSNLAGWGIWYYRDDFRISDWNYLPCPHSIKKHGSRLIVTEIANTEISVEFTDLDEEVLLIELKDEVFAQELALSFKQEADYLGSYADL
jgi:hypothetical protein